MVKYTPVLAVLGVLAVGFFLFQSFIQLEPVSQPTIGIPTASERVEEISPEQPESFVTEQETMPERVEKILRVMSFNIHRGEGQDGRLDLDRIADVIRTTNADVIGLQEVDRFFGERSEYLDQAAILAEKLGMYHVYGPALKRFSISGGESGYFGNAVLSRYPITFAENRVMSKIGTMEDRAFLHAIVDVNGDRVHFITTHLGLDAGERLGHVNEILQYLGELPNPKFLVGDWNTGPNGPEVELVTKSMLDTAVVVGKEDNFTYDRRSNGVADIRIDYVFAAGVEIRDNAVTYTDASDHLPVFSEVVIPEKDITDSV